MSAERSADHCSSSHAAITLLQTPNPWGATDPELLLDLMLYRHVASRHEVGSQVWGQKASPTFACAAPPAVMEIDTLGTFQMSRAAHPHLKRGGGGVVVNISATLHYGATFYQVGCLIQRLNALRVQGLWRPFLKQNGAAEEECPAPAGAILSAQSTSSSSATAQAQVCSARCRWAGGLRKAVSTLCRRCTCRRPRWVYMAPTTALCGAWLTTWPPCVAGARVGGQGGRGLADAEPGPGVGRRWRPCQRRGPWAYRRHSGCGGICRFQGLECRVSAPKEPCQRRGPRAYRRHSGCGGGGGRF
jgi:hypothetical protein